jgi:hypothetical protein
MATTKRGSSVSSVSGGSTSYRKGATFPFNEITEPGSYYNHNTGWLCRVPDDILALGHSPLMNIVSYDENFVTKISDDPWIPVNKARQICSNMDFAVNF